MAVTSNKIMHVLILIHNYIHTLALCNHENEESELFVHENEFMYGINPKTSWSWPANCK